jgi:AbrB family looped-hinge helix DNA binding protein
MTTKKEKNPGAGPSCCAIQGIVTVDERGQMVLPKELRAKAGIKAGDKLAVTSWEKDGKVCCIALRADQGGQSRVNGQGYAGSCDGRNSEQVMSKIKVFWFMPGMIRHPEKRLDSGSPTKSSAGQVSPE